MYRPALLLLLTVLLSTGCNHYLAKYTIRPPNHNLSLDKIEQNADPALPGSVIDHRLRVEIDDPPASLSVWVLEPTRETFIGLDTENKPIFEPLERPTAAQRNTPIGSILILHGFHDSINQMRFLAWARIFASEGYRVVMIDQRGHGESTGDWSTYGVQEAQDTRDVLDHLENRGLLTHPVGVAAVSFGSSTGLLLARDDPRIQAMLCVSAFTTMREVVVDFGRAIGFNLSDQRFNHVIHLTGEMGDFNPDDAAPIEAITDTDIPILLVHGEDDDLIPITHSIRLYRAADRDNVELIRVKSADHTTLGESVLDPVRLAALDWFERYLQHGEMNHQVTQNTQADQ